MMRILMAISLSALALGCAHKDAGKGLAKLSGRNKSPENLLPAADNSAFDSTFYIGYVDYFPETKEFYTAVFHKDGYEYPDEDLLESKLDSVILADDDWGRERLPMEEARKLLMLSGMDTLCIYNRSHELLSRSPLRRIEYLWNGLESYFVAVYGSDGKLEQQTEELYGISADYSSLVRPSFTSEEFADARLNEYVVKKLNVSRGLDWNIRHYRTTTPETTYSVISSYTMETNEAFSYLTSLEKNNFQILNQELNNYHFLNILPLPIKTNGKPLLLVSAGYPSSDVLWDYLASYDGKSYETVDYNRIHVKSVER